jgi:hypothetical protein
MSDPILESKLSEEFDAPHDQTIMLGMTIWHKLLLTVGLLVTIPTTFWFIQRHVPEPWWYPFLAVLFVDGGAVFWFYTLQHRSKSHGQDLIAGVMLAISAVGMISAFFLYMLGTTFDENTTGVFSFIIVSVIVANIAAGFAFEFTDPAKKYHRKQRKDAAARVIEGKRLEHGIANQSADALAEQRRQVQEKEMIELKQKNAAQQSELDIMKSELRRLQSGTDVPKQNGHAQLAPPYAPEGDRSPK